MFHHVKTLESKYFSVSFDLRDEGYEQDGTDGQLVPQVSIWSKDGTQFIGRWDVSRELGNRIYKTLKNLDVNADEEAVISYIAQSLDKKVEKAPLAEEPDVYKVIIVSAGGVKHDLLFDMTEDEATRYCEENDWTYLDSNTFEWSLDVARQY